MYTLADVYKTFPSGCTEEYKILRAFEMGKQTSNKEIESLLKHILDLQKDKGNLTDRVRELEQQIEKMKCCANCKHSRTEYEHCRTNKHEKWEIKENEKIELFDKWYDENYDEWAEGEEGIALREELEQAFKSGIVTLEKENAELRKVAEFQQSSNMSRHFENKKLKEGLAVGSTFNKALNSMNKNLEEERDKYRNMVFDKDNQLTKAKEIIKTFLGFAETFGYSPSMDRFITEAEQFLKGE